MHCTHTLVVCLTIVSAFIGWSNAKFTYYILACPGDTIRHTCPQPDYRINVYGGMSWVANIPHIPWQSNQTECTKQFNETNCSDWSTMDPFVRRLETCCNGRTTCTVRIPLQYHLMVCNGVAADWVMLKFGCFPKNIYERKFGELEQSQNESYNSSYCTADPASYHVERRKVIWLPPQHRRSTQSMQLSTFTNRLTQTTQYTTSPQSLTLTPLKILSSTLAEIIGGRGNLTTIDSPIADNFTTTAEYENSSIDNSSPPEEGNSTTTVPDSKSVPTGSIVLQLPGKKLSRVTKITTTSNTMGLEQSTSSEQLESDTGNSRKHGERQIPEQEMSLLEVMLLTFGVIIFIGVVVATLASVCARQCCFVVGEDVVDTTVTVGDMDEIEEARVVELQSPPMLSAAHLHNYDKLSLVTCVSEQYRADETIMQVDELAMPTITRAPSKDTPEILVNPHVLVQPYEQPYEQPYTTIQQSDAYSQRVYATINRQLTASLSSFHPSTQPPTSAGSQYISPPVIPRPIVPPAATPASVDSNFILSPPLLSPLVIPSPMDSPLVSQNSTITSQSPYADVPAVQTLVDVESPFTKTENEPIILV